MRTVSDEHPEAAVMEPAEIWTPTCTDLTKSLERDNILNFLHPFMTGRRGEPCLSVGPRAESTIGAGTQMTCRR